MQEVARLVEEIKRLQPECVRLSELVDKALSAPGLEEAAAHEPVNWTDLSCVDVLFAVSIHGDVMWQVEIEEVAPYSEGFCRFVERFLREHGYNNVRVMTSW